MKLFRQEQQILLKVVFTVISKISNEKALHTERGRSLLSSSVNHISLVASRRNEVRLSNIYVKITSDNCLIKLY